MAYRAVPTLEEVTACKEAEVALFDILGREPSAIEIARELGWHEDKVTKVKCFTIDEQAQDDDDFEFRFRLTIKNHEMEKRRLALKMRQVDLAKIVGISAHKINQIECMRQYPTYVEQEKIADALKTKIDIIFPGWIQAYSERWKAAEKDKIVKMNSVALNNPEVLALPDEIPLPEENAQHVLESKIIEDILKDLTERERAIIELRFGLGGEAPATLEDTAQVLGVTRERIRQIEAKALMKMRENRHFHKLYH